MMEMVRSMKILSMELITMKMDNLIRATREGTVKMVHVVEGRHVAHGELLLDYRP